MTSAESGNFCFVGGGFGQRLTAEYEGLLEDNKDTKKKLEASRARGKSLTAEMKTLKVQISTLLDKGKHDDELVDTLLVRNSNQNQTRYT